MRAGTVGSVMTPFPFSIEGGERLSRARALMREHDIRHLAVTENGALVGVISERDIGLAAGPDPIPEAEDVAIRAIAVVDAYVVSLDASLQEVLFAMADRRIGSVLVTRRDKLVGIFTATDACRCFAEHLRARSPSGGEAA